MDYIIYILIGLLAVVVVLGIVSIIANERNYISTGTVVSKDYTPARLTMQSAGKVMIPITHPEQFEIAIQGVKNGKTVTYWKTVSKDEYEQYQIDMQYP